MKFRIVSTRHKPRQFRVHIVGDNGEKLFTSESYTRKSKAENVIELVRTGSRAAYIIEDRT